jgi:hypothetical protein
MVVPRLPKNPESCPCRVIEEYLELLVQDFEMPLSQIEGPFFRSTHGKNGRKILKMPLGKNSIGEVGIEWAKELLLPNPSKFTGHCWRRTCSTISSDSGVNVTSLMSHMGWTSPKTAIRYVQKSRQSSYSMSMYLVQAQRAGLSSEQLFSLTSNSKVDESSSRHLSSFPVDVVPSGSLGRHDEKNSSLDAPPVLKDCAIDLPLRHLEAVDGDITVAPKLIHLEKFSAKNEITVLDLGTAVGVGTAAGVRKVVGVEEVPVKVFGAENSLSVRQTQTVEKDVRRTIGSVIGSFCNNGTVNFTINYVSK